VIEDNGIGRAKAAELKKNRSALHRSLGLSVTEERIEILNQYHKGLSALTVEDKIADDGAALGTRVELTVPLIKEHVLN
jgi:hypothetical protein